LTSYQHFFVDDFADEQKLYICVFCVLKWKPFMNSGYIFKQLISEKYEASLYAISIVRNMS